MILLISLLAAQVFATPCYQLLIHANQRDATVQYTDPTTQTQHEKRLGFVPGSFAVLQDDRGFAIGQMNLVYQYFRYEENQFVFLGFAQFQRNHRYTHQAISPDGAIALAVREDEIDQTKDRFHVDAVRYLGHAELSAPRLTWTVHHASSQHIESVTVNNEGLITIQFTNRPARSHQLDTQALGGGGLLPKP